MTFREELDKLPATIKVWGGAVLVLGALVGSALGLIALRIAPLVSAIDDLKTDRKDDRGAIVELRVAVAKLTTAVETMRYYDMPRVADKVDDVGDEAIATKAQLRNAADRNYLAVRDIGLKVDSMLVLQKRQPRTTRP